MDVKELQERIDKCFNEAFVHTSLKARLEDIRKECDELMRFTDIKSLKSEAGDLLNTLIKLHSECGWDLEENSMANIEKIKNRMIQYKSMGRKTNVAILGGAFNPPTKSHIEVCNLVLNASRWADEVWLAPVYKHLEGKGMADFDHRMNMLKIASKNNPMIKVFDYERRHDLGGETFHFLNKLVHDPEYDNYRFAFIIGEDRANNIESWYNSDELLRMGVPFIVVPRSGVMPKPGVDWYTKNGHMCICYDKSGDSIHQYSSTMARNALTRDKKKFAIEIMGVDVYAYIKDNNITF